MKYWRLYSSAEKEVGYAPQITDPLFDGQYNDPDQLWNLHSKPFSPKTKIPQGKMHKKAKLTDLMSASFLSSQLFVSDKLRKILESSILKGVEFATTNLITNTGVSVKSNIMHPFATDHPYVDMANSEFQISNIMGDLIQQTLKFDSFRHFENKQKEIMTANNLQQDVDLQTHIYISKLVFKENLDFGICSVFDVHHAGIGFYISEELKGEILAKSCTGVICRDVNERYP